MGLRKGRTPVKRKLYALFLDFLMSVVVGACLVALALTALLFFLRNLFTKK